MAGRTDRAIILETLTLAGVDEPRRYVDSFIAGLGEHAPAARVAVAERGQPLPGAAAALAALVAVSGAMVRVPVRAPVLKPAPTPVPAPVPVPAPALVPAPAPAARVAVASGVACAPAGGGGTNGGTAAKGGGTATDGGTAAGGGTGNGARPSRRVHQSVVTGNIRLLAEVKLAALGLRNGLDLCIGAYGDDHEDRTELVQVARRRAAAVHGRTPAAFAGTSTVVIGDTPLDVTAALAAGARAVGVATGSHSAADLRAAGAHAVLPDLTDTDVVLKALLG
jgi:hypothetical protein